MLKMAEEVREEGQPQLSMCENALRTPDRETPLFAVTGDECRDSQLLRVLRIMVEGSSLNRTFILSPL